MGPLVEEVVEISVCLGLLVNFDGLVGLLEDGLLEGPGWMDLEGSILPVSLLVFLPTGGGGGLELSSSARSFGVSLPANVPFCCGSEK